MSPSEFDLRAVLRDGEGDAPDAGRIISGALRQQFDRRRRIRSMATAVVAVAVVGVGGTEFVRHTFRSSSGGGATSDFAGRAAGAAGGSSAPVVPSHHGALSQRTSGAASVPVSGYVVDACPGQFPRLALPGGGGTDQFGADGPLFDGTVAAMTVCRYADVGGKVTRVAVARADVADIVAALESGTVGGLHDLCRTGLDQYAIYAEDKSGSRLRTVTMAAACNEYDVTNGTAQRYVPISAVNDVLP